MRRTSLLLADLEGRLVTEQKILTERGQAAVAKLREPERRAAHRSDE